jgi:hypothetical protein
MRKFEEFLAEHDPNFLSEEKVKWIQGTHMKKGALKDASKEAGKSMGEYCKNPPSTKAKHRCSLAKTLKSLPKHHDPKKED